MLKNRIEAGKLLAKEIKKLNLKEPIVVAIPRGGVVVGAEIAKELNAPMDLLFIKKIPAPDNEELAIGSISENGMVFINETLAKQFNVDEEYLQQVAIDKIQEIARLRDKYKVEPIPLDMKDVIIVDDGIATGSTMYLAANTIVRDYPNKIIIAAPVAPADEEIEKTLISVSHKYIVLEKHSPFIAVGRWYEDFHQLSDEEIIKTLKQIEN